MNRLQRAALALGAPKNLISRSAFAKFVVAVLAAGQLLLPLSEAQAATLSSARVSLSDPRPSQTGVTYTLTVSGVSSANIQCVKVDFSSAAGSLSAIGNSFSAASASITAASSTLVNSLGTNWTATPSTNSISYTNSAGGVTPGTTTGATFVIAGVNNSSVADTGYWLHFGTFNNTNCSSSPVDNVTVGFIYTNGSTLSLTVDQTLTFTVNAVASGQACDGTTTTAASTATTIPFGTVTPASNGVVCQDLTASTNATNGYTIYARYTGAPTNGLSQTLTDHTGSNASPSAFPAAGATEAYGYTTNDATLGTGTANRFTNPSQGWAAMTTNNAEVAYESAGVNSTTYRVGHQVAVTTLTRPGTYTTTVIYTCTPVY